MTPRTGRTRRDGLQRQRGATLIEFSLALLLGLLPMVLGILQVAALLVAKNELNLAAFLAAR
ncbi:MAG TPA: TadE/TadG family type IV pilus assembly protein, partial [Burkholderiaceae bacterium]|nr:TadE/TadG family type IV pilus assembly protein [Burkholderiaceae bacterium]